MNKKFWMAGFLVIPKVYAVIASPFSEKKTWVQIKPPLLPDKIPSIVLC